MIDCLQENKPQNQILAKDLEEMLIQQQENDPYVSVDQCGLARIIAKQQLTEQNCKQRLKELHKNVKDIGLQLLKQTAILAQLDK